MFDIVIRGGTVVDGTGATRRTADIGIVGNQITDVGPALGRGHREIAADGLLVTIRIRRYAYALRCTSHLGSEYLTPSSWHGVTTVVMGNCGVICPRRAG